MNRVPPGARSAGAVPHPVPFEPPPDPLPEMGSLARTYLLPGELIVCREPSVVTTILGSCVGVALFDRSTGVGGLNHFLLPQASGHPTMASPRFGNVAMQKLLDEMLAAGAARKDLRGKVFGGARVLRYRDIPGHRDLGAANYDMAFAFLEEMGIRITGRDVGGRHGRKLIYFPQSGDVWVRRL